MSLTIIAARALCVLGIVAILSAPYGTAQAPAVATGDSRVVSEPTFPAACQVLTATFHDVNEDVPSSVESANTEPDQARLQAALTACAGTNQAVQLSMDNSGNNAFLTGPISIPSGVTLLIDPGVTLFFSRNAQDYDTTPGVHTCGTVSSASNTASCQNLISINSASNSGIMGYGKLDGRGGDVVLNSFPTSGYESSTAGKTWWDLANDAGTLGGSQQNPRFIQISKGTNITFYKFTMKNAPNFHVAVNFVNGFTVWGLHIVTPYNAHNTDGIDPGNATNVTITQSWISDGDDNIALGANAGPTANVSVIHNHFFAGHGESIGSLTSNGVSNALFDDNAMYGDADLDGTNSTAIRIKSANDRGGLVQNIQYSNSCLANHGTQVQFTPVYNTNSGTQTPNFKNILLQNLRFSNQGAVATGSFTFLGAVNNNVVNPLGVTLDNVTVDTIASSNLVAPTNAQITLGPGQVSSNLVSLLTPYNGVNGNVIKDSRTAPTLNAPGCTFPFLAPALTGPKGINQTVTNGQYPTAVAILQPGIAKTQYPYPTGTVTITDEGSRTFSATLSGATDTFLIPITVAPMGTHTYTASYSGDSTYPAIASFGTYSVTVNGGSLSNTTLALSGVPATTVYGSPFTAVATLSGSGGPTGSVSFLVNGAVYATVPAVSGRASYNFSPALGTFNISAIYNGDTYNAGSTSAAVTVNVAAAPTNTAIQSGSMTGVVGTPVGLTASVTSTAGTPTGSVVFSYTAGNSTTPVTLGSGTLANGVAVYSALLPQGADNVTAAYNGGGNFAASVSTALTVTVSAAPPVPASTAPIALPYTVSTLVGGGTSNSTCTGHLDTFGDGCVGTSVQLPSGTDLRSVVADPFGNVYFTDANAALIRKVSTAGIVTQFAGYVSGTACLPTATVGCTPTLVKLSGKPRGIFVDAAGNLYIAGYSDNKTYYVRAADGKLYLLAGTGTAPTNTTDAGGDGGTASSALLKGPRGIATDTAGNIYIADSGDNRIREIVLPSVGLPGAGNIQTIAGTGTASSTGDNGKATSATLSNPQGVAVDANGNVYIAENSHVRAVCVSCTAGTGLYALLNQLGVSAPVNGNIYSVAGTSSTTNSKLTPGLANTVSMGPQKISLDADGNLYIADSSNNVIWFEDGRTGYTRVLVGGASSTACPGSSIGDGCAGPQAIVGSNGGNGFGLGLDAFGNLYVADSTNVRIRKVSTNLGFSVAGVGSSVAQIIQLHSQPGDTLISPTLTSPDFTIAPVSCKSVGDTTQDCTYNVVFQPAVAGLRTTPLFITTAGNNAGRFALSGNATGAGATIDPAAQLTFGAGVSPSSVAVDALGNILVADSISNNALRFAPSSPGAGRSAVATTLGSFTSPAAITADTLGNVYVADASTGLVTQIGSNGVTQTLKSTFTRPQGLATDVYNDLFVLDAGAKTVVELASNGTAARVVASGLTAPTAIATDSSGGIYVADAGAIYRYDPQSFARTLAATTSATVSAIAVDAAGNLLLADSDTGSLLAIPASSKSTPFTIAGGLPGSTLALDAAGNIYTASGSGQLTQLLRTQGTATYTGAGAATSTLNLLSTGTTAASLSFTDSDTLNFTFGLNTSPDCSGSASGLTVTSGGVCSFSSGFRPSAQQNYSNVIRFVGNAANAALAIPAGLQITQLGNNTPPPMLTVAAQPNGAVQGTSTLTLGATLTFTGPTPTGSVTFAVDDAAPALGGCSLTYQSGVEGCGINWPIASLSVGSHTVSVTFSGDGTYAPQSSTATLLITAGGNTITPTVPTTTGSAGAATTLLQFSATFTGPVPTGTVGASVDNGSALNAACSLTGSHSATCQLPYPTGTLSAGSHLINVFFLGDTNYNATSATGTLNLR